MGLTLDAGALIALERRDRRAALLLDDALSAGERVAVPCGVLAQVWRDGARQVVLARLVAARETDLVALGPAEATAIGLLCGRSRTSDVVDVSVVLCARRRGDEVVTSDPGELRRIDPSLGVIAV